ncbi:MAG: ComEA family DNA-binding protein [Legionella sp.]
MKIKYVPVVLSIVLSPALALAAEGIVAKQATTSSQIVNKVNLNKADAQQLTHIISGIGIKRAEAIVSHREKHGAFKSVEELAEVKGIGKQYVESHLSQLQEIFTIE